MSKMPKPICKFRMHVKCCVVGPVSENVSC